MQSPSLSLQRSSQSLIFLSLILTSFLLSFVSSDDGFCSAQSVSETDNKRMYWKVTNPTLSPNHLQYLPGFTRSVYKRDHTLITPESYVFNPLPDWSNTLGAYLITPAMGSHFVMYLAKMQENSSSAFSSWDTQRFIFVVQGAVTFTNASSSISHKLMVDSYAYIPPYVKHSINCEASSTLLIFERKSSTINDYISLMNSYHLSFRSWVKSTQHFCSSVWDVSGAWDLSGAFNMVCEKWKLCERYSLVGSTDKQPLLETPGEVFELRKLLPTSLDYDFNIHIMDFQPGEFLNVKEVHYNQQGFLLLEGQGIYRLGESWYPVQTGDAIWMAPFVTQWYAALGKSRSRYLLYKDVNRNPL